MRKAIKVILLVILALLFGCGYNLDKPDYSVSGPKINKKLNFKKELDNELEKFVSKPGYGLLVTEWRQKWQEVENYVQSQTGNATDIHLDVVLNMHPSGDLVTSVDAETLISQDRVYERLVKLNPEIVGLEGFIDESITPEAVAKGFYELDKRTSAMNNGHLSPYDDYIRTATDHITKLGAYRFITAYKTRAVGIEYPELVYLHAKTVGMETQHPKSFDIINMGLMILRSRYAIAKLIDCMKKNGYKRGAIAIGLMHGFDMISFCQSIGLRADFYVAMPDSWSSVKLKPLY